MKRPRGMAGGKGWTGGLHAAVLALTLLGSIAPLAAATPPEMLLQHRQRTPNPTFTSPCSPTATPSTLANPPSPPSKPTRTRSSAAFSPSSPNKLCFGGTKAGIGLSEAVVFFDKALANEFDYRCKQSGQLASKMRFMAAPWSAMLNDGSWLRNAEHANGCARMLSEKVRDLPGIREIYPVQANAGFLDLPQAVHDRLKSRGWAYYVFIGGGARFMCSWATTYAEVEELASDIVGASP